MKSTPVTAGSQALGAAMVLVLLVGGCGGDDERSPSDGDRSAGSATTTVPPTAPADAAIMTAVEAAYREATAAELQFDSEVGSFDPVAFKERVGRFLTGAQYEASFQISQQRRLRGEVFRPPGLQPGEIAPVVTLQGSGRATVRDCAADHPTVRAATGERVDEPIDGRELIVAEMVLENGQWKIAKSTALGQSCTV